MDSAQPQASYDDVFMLQKQKALARFHSFRRIAKLWKVLEAVVLLGMISWSTARVPTLLKTTVSHLIQFSAYLLNHHVVFLIGNGIIALLVVICRRTDATAAASNLSSSGGGDDLYDDYVKHSEATAAQPRQDTVPPVVEEKQIVLCSESSVVPPRDDDVAAAIEKATKEIKRFQRTQSEKLKRDISARTLTRSETDNNRISGERPSEIETLSSEEFRQTVDAFIDKHWSKRNTKRNNNNNNQFDGDDQYRNKYYPLMNENAKAMIHVRA